MVMAILGILTATATPFFFQYYQSAKLKLAAEEIAAFLNQARQVGIRENAGVCVQGTATAMLYYRSTCTGAAIGSFALPEGMSLAGDSLSFNYLGAATPTTYTVTNVQDGHSLRVTVAISGRIKICRGGGGPCT